MIRSLRIPVPGFIPNFILVAILIIIARFFAQNIVAGKSIQIVSGFIGIALFLTILKRPIVGLLVLPFVSYLIPAELQVTGLPMVSAGMAISGITLFVAIVHISFRRIHPNISWVWILLLAMAINMSFVIERTGGIAWYRMLIFIQGVIPFLIFSLIVNTESEGRRVLKYWLVAYSCFAVLHLARGGLGYSDQSLLRSLATVRSAELGGHNPNTLGWIGLLYLPLAPVIAFASNKQQERGKWLLAFFCIVLLLTFSFSRSSMIGMFLTICLLFIFLNKKMKEPIKFMIPLIISILFLYFVWTASVSLGIMDISRSISRSSLMPIITERTNLIIQGWQMVALRPWTGWGMNPGYGTHSGFTKAALEYGLFYFFMFCIPYIYFIKTSYFVARFHSNFQVRFFSTGILVASIVAVSEGIFGITLFAVGYAQVFWLFIGYLHLAKKDDKLFLNHSVRGTSVCV